MMVTLKFEKEINASAQKVWNVLWNKDTYAQWTSSFNPISRIEADWRVGGKTYFKDADGNGMVTVIDAMNEPYELVFRQVGEVNNGVEDTTSEKVKSYAGSFEKYFLSETDGVTKLNASVDTSEEYSAFMEKAFIEGLEIVKKLAEEK
ncbi:MAG: SRPBCC domain-containing protein [Bacteroidia bacterium]|nr:SRPBCC domain-containing protein [Bacteroidia bacterium]